MSFNILKSAKSIAIEAWRRQVVTKYGERFQDFDFAACPRYLCVKGGIAGTKRCTVSGFPCAADMTEEDKARIQHALSGGPADYDQDRGRTDRTYRADRTDRAGDFSTLEESEIQELQRLLGVNPDGIFGDQSQDALRQFRRRAGLRVDGPPRHEDLERLRDRR
ncbi:MAG: peptidoglycan-binding domain-containing protein [Rhodomicrobium sp.]